MADVLCKPAPFVAALENKSLKFPLIMGVVNTSPDSFYSANKNFDQALNKVEKLVAEGADIIDIGGEATNPKINVGKQSPQIEYDAVVPLVERVRNEFSVAISVDTSKYEIMRDSLGAGADMINDQRALAAEGAVKLIAETGAAACIMHSFTDFRTPGSTSAQQLLNDIVAGLQFKVQQCVAAGIPRDRLFVDPGFGQGNYGKDTAENFYLLAHLYELEKTGCRTLIGWSRKSMIGEVTGRKNVEDRLYGSLAAAAFSMQQNAAIIRTHDVAATKDVAQVYRAYAQYIRE